LPFDRATLKTKSYEVLKLIGINLAEILLFCKMSKAKFMIFQPTEVQMSKNFISVGFRAEPLLKFLKENFPN
jgi:hypothetical protein